MCLWRGVSQQADRFVDPDGRTDFDCTATGSCSGKIDLSSLQDGDVIRTAGATIEVGAKTLTVTLSPGFSNGSSAAFTGPNLVPPGPPGADLKKNMYDAKYMGPIDFRNHVKNKGPWDYKQVGKKGEYEPFGNFHYGATGRSHGFAAEILLQEAGRAQFKAGTSLPQWGVPGIFAFPETGSGSFGDDPIDQFWIQQGIRYADEP